MTDWSIYIYGLFDCFCLVILVLVIFSVSFASCFVLFCFPWNFCSIFFLLHTYHFSYRLHLQFCVTAFSKQWFVDVGALVGGEGGGGIGTFSSKLCSIGLCFPFLLEVLFINVYIYIHLEESVCTKQLFDPHLEAVTLQLVVQATGNY